MAYGPHQVPSRGTRISGCKTALEILIDDLLDKQGIRDKYTLDLPYIPTYAEAKFVEDEYRKVGWSVVECERVSKRITLTR